MKQLWTATALALALSACGILSPGDDSSTDDSSNMDDPVTSGSMTLPQAAFVDEGTWAVTLNTTFMPEGGTPFGMDTDVQGCLSEGNPLGPFLSAETCSFTFGEPVQLPTGSSISVAFDCAEENGSRDVGEGVLIVDSTTFGLSFQSTLTVGAEGPITAMVQIEGERIAGECEQ